jgi:hypothetical protein
MRMIVRPAPDGRISHGAQILGQAVPEGAAIVDVPSVALQPYEVAYLVDGQIEIRLDFRGYGPRWFNQNAPAGERFTSREITEIGIVPPNELGHPVTPGWEDMAMQPRPETKAERAARVQAEADAAVEAEAARKRKRVLTPLQIRMAADRMRIRDAIETVVADPATPRVVMDYWEYSPSYPRSSPVWAEVLPLLGFTEADLDQLFDLAETL